ncbi:hypothetical protein M4L89_14555 [Staphylococcus equorum]|uniref:Uncharacterized protein n=1 Tax=Staphylococcus equorum TaxID=246432 RepID=A0A9X4LBL3_9STAP|nr:hypothetical protein [Staphylococcus equorum]MDG0847434.1 hypothetical protein [Staphylococcus equorum]
MEFNYEVETKLINALKANTPEQFYAISKGETSEQIWNTTAAGLTAIQFKYPEKQNEINKFLEKYYELLVTEKTTFEYEIDNSVQEDFLQELDNILKDV